jgi:hypothetical protein
VIGNAIIAFFVFGAFFRAAQQYNKNGVEWGAIGLASFFIPNFLIPFLAAILLTSIGAGRVDVAGWLSISAFIGFGAGVAIVIWVYNKLMERAIDGQAVLDSAPVPPSQGGSENH